MSLLMAHLHLREIINSGSLTDPGSIAKNKGAIVRHFLCFSREKGRFVGKIFGRTGRFFGSDWYFLIPPPPKPHLKSSQNRFVRMHRGTRRQLHPQEQILDSCVKYIES